MTTRSPSRGVDDARARVDLARAADSGLAFDEDARVNHRVGADLDPRIDVRRGRIDQRDAGGHQFLVLLLSDHRADLGELGAAVDAANLARMLDCECRDGAAAAPVDPDEIGQVVLALGVVGPDRVERVEERFEREGVNPRVDLRQLALRRRRVALLDNPRDAALVADDAAVAVWTVGVRREDGGQWPLPLRASSPGRAASPRSGAGRLPRAGRASPAVRAAPGTSAASAWPVPS